MFLEIVIESRPSQTQTRSFTWSQSSNYDRNIGMSKHSLYCNIYFTQMFAFGFISQDSIKTVLCVNSRGVHYCSLLNVI